MDILLSLIAIIFLMPIFIIVAIAIKIEDPKGKIIFTQERNGVYPTTFKMYKFRSMVHNAEELLEEFKKDIPVKKDDKHFKWWYLIIIILIGVLIGALLISLID